MALVAAAGAAGAFPAAASAEQPATWNFQQARIPAAQAPGSYGRGALVAVVDTWVDARDSEFGGRVVDEADCVNGNGTCRDHSYSPDACEHGTHVAGTIASADYGVAPEARLLAVQVVSADGSGGCGGSDQDVAAGIAFAVSHGAQVINMSLGDQVPLLLQSAPVTAAVRQAAAAGVVVVIAAGNSSLPLADNYGSSAVTVAATGPSGQLAGYSNGGIDVDLAAPGGDTGSAAQCSPATCILSTLPGNKLGLLEGTSMAAPHVSGTAALLLAQNPRRGVSDVIHTLEATAMPLAGAGSGLLDASAALAAAEAPPSVTPPPAATPPASTGSAVPAGPTPGGATAGTSSITPGALAAATPVPALNPTPTVAGPAGTAAITSPGPAAPVAPTAASGRQMTAPARAAGGGARSGGHGLIAVMALLLVLAVGAAVVSAWSRQGIRPGRHSG